MNAPRDPYRRHGDGPTDPPPRVVMGAPVRPPSRNVQRPEVEPPVSDLPPTTDTRVQTVGWFARIGSRWNPVGIGIGMSIPLAVCIYALGGPDGTAALASSIVAAKNETAALRATVKQLDETVLAVSRRAEERAKSEMSERNKLEARVGVVEQNVLLVGEGIAIINGRAPGPGWPSRRTDDWSRPANLPPYDHPLFTTSRAFATKPKDQQE